MRHKILSIVTAFYLLFSQTGITMSQNTGNLPTEDNHFIITEVLLKIDHEIENLRKSDTFYFNSFTNYQFTKTKHTVHFSLQDAFSCTKKNKSVHRDELLLDLPPPHRA